MYDASDILDLCQLEAMNRGSSRDMGCFNPLLFCLRNPLHAHDMGSRLKKLNEKLIDIENRSKAFDFHLLTSYEDNGTRNIKSCRLASRETTGELDKLDLVGEKIEEDTRNLVESLTREEKTIHEHNKVMVFAIVGVGGIGKTTLAKSIFNNEIIKEKFNKKIWLSVNQDFNDHNLLERSITEAGGDQQEPRNTEAALLRTLKQALKECKTLLVMDDVWDHQAWDRVLKYPFTNSIAPGSRVLVTTRHDTVARGMRAKEPYHHINKLDPEDGWSLLKKQVVSNENKSQVDMLKDIGMGIVAKCDGLPLAVKVMGGLLLQKKATRSDWNKVLNDSIWSDSLMTEELNNAIYLSYQDLNPTLKPCFLHFSLLPKSSIFSVDDIIGMWISEGFLHGGSPDLEELGMEYIDELILRNLIEHNVKFVDQSVCNMHDVVRSFAQYVARDEALAVHNSQMDTISKVNSSQMFIRLSLETKGSESNEFEWMSLQAQLSLRTLISVGHIKINPGDSLDTFSCLRTVHIQDANVDALAKSLVQLKHLRYLAIKHTNISMLPENIGKMKLLQHINLRGCGNLTKLPGSIGQLGHLRFLNFAKTRINNVAKGFNSLTNLRKLYGFPAHMDGHLSSLEELGPLSKLIDLSIYGLENIPSSSFARKTKLYEKFHLRYLRLVCTSRHGDDDPLLKEDENTSNKGQQQMEEVFHELCPPHSLDHLIIRGYFGRQLPRWMMLTAVDAPLGNLRILMMKDFPYCTELPDSLCQLPCLEVLQIEQAPAIKRVGPEFLQSHHHEHPSAPENLVGSPIKVQVIKCVGIERIGNMPKTQELTINRCPKLKVLEVMPALRRLILEDYSMTTLPRYLQDVHPRHLLEIYCDVSLLTSMAGGKSGPEWVKFCHIQQVKAYAHDNGTLRKWYVFYTRDPFSFRTNISSSAILQA